MIVDRKSLDPELYLGAAYVTLLTPCGKWSHLGGRTGAKIWLPSKPCRQEDVDDPYTVTA